MICDKSHRPRCTTDHTANMASSVARRQGPACLDGTWQQFDRFVLAENTVGCWPAGEEAVGGVAVWPDRLVRDAEGSGGGGAGARATGGRRDLHQARGRGQAHLRPARRRLLHDQGVLQIWLLRSCLSRLYTPSVRQLEILLIYRPGSPLYLFLSNERKLPLHCDAQQVCNASLSGLYFAHAAWMAAPYFPCK